jgi:tetratricopeptide (TPR) repeat protein
MDRFRRLLLLLLALAAACSPPKPIPLTVEYDGCKAVTPGPHCVLGADRKLRLWVGAPPDARVEIQADGKRIKAAAEPVRDGQGFSLTLPAGAQRLDLLASSPEGRASWSLSFAERQSGPNLLDDVANKLGEMHQEVTNGHLSTAREILQSIRLPDPAAAESRFFLSYYRGLLAEKEGDTRSAMIHIQEAQEIGERVKVPRYRWMAEHKRAILLLGVGRFGEAVQLFERLRREPYGLTACEDAQLPANQAWGMLMARETGESFGDPTPLLETALAKFETCSRYTPEDRVNFLIDLALAHLQEGRLAQAKDLLAQSGKLEPDPPLPLRLWWLDLEARIRLREERPAEALRLFEESEQLATSPDDRLRAAVGKAQAHEDLGERPAALEILRKAEALLDELSRQIPLQEGRETFMATRQAVVNLHVELLLRQGSNAEALEVARHSRSRVLRQLERRGNLANLSPGRREQWERLLSEYQERRTALEESAKDDWKLPADELGRARAGRRATAEEAKRILDRAYQVLPRERWAERLAPPRPGELILAYHSLPRGWVGFAADGTGVQVHRFELPAALPRGEELSRRLLLPFRAAIARAKRIRILAGGPLQTVDFHGLPFGNDVLLAKTPVVYGLDLPVAASASGGRERRALLVANPSGDLPGALEEAGKVVAVLRAASRPWVVEELESSRASEAAVRRSLPAADLLHYAGHGFYSGFGGWDSNLLLAGETRLTLGDLLTLDRVPAWVVLSACDTGRSSSEVPVESLGLAHAFVLAGSRAVIASTRPAKDRDMSAFFPGLYREWDREPELAVALQRAQLAWRSRNPGADWEGFRLFEP